MVNAKKNSKKYENNQWFEKTCFQTERHNYTITFGKRKKNGKKFKKKHWFKKKKTNF